MRSFAPQLAPARRAFALALLVLAAVAAPAAAQGPRGAAPDPRSLAATAKDQALRHYLQGVYAESIGDLPGAIDEIGRAFAYDPSASDLAVRLADLSLQTGNPTACLDYARRAIALGDTSGKARLLSGNALASLGRVSEARGEFQRATGEDSTNAPAWLALGRASEELGDLPAAAAALRRARALSPEDIETTWRLAGLEARLDNLTAADSLLDEVDEAHPGMPGVALTRGWIAERQGRLADAARAYAAHLEGAPGDSRVRRQLLQTYVRLDDAPHAHEQAKILAKESPDDIDVVRVLVALELREGHEAEAAQAARDLRAATPGRLDSGAFAVSVLGFTGKEGEARKMADQIANEQPGDYRAWILAAETWAARELAGKLEPEVDRRYARAEAVRPDSVNARVVLARSYSRTRRFAAAEKTLAGALELDPQSPQLWLEQAFTRERRKDLAGAEAAARRSLELDPRNAPALNFLGYMFADANIKLDEAEPLIRRALELEPKNPYYIDSLGWALFRKGKLEDARAELVRALELSGGDPEIHGHLGDVYVALGQRGDAKLQYQKGLQLDPTNDDLTRKLESLR